MDNNEERINKDIINKITEKKYLLTSFFSKDKFKNMCLFRRIFFGLKCNIKSFIENLNNEYNLKNLIPELVEKKDPPIIVNIKKTKERLSGESSKDMPIFETLLVREIRIELKL
tara:strand:+ start:560 stop:901 length:342 start_codon:yes stop_codon:yes gene_type:complete